MKKVVHLGYEHNSKDVRIYYKECCSLSSAGYDVTYITSAKHDEEGVITENGVKIVTLGVNKKRGFARVKKFWNDIFKSAMEYDADIYHLHEFILIPVGKKLIKNGKKVIYDTHENYSMQISKRLSSGSVSRRILRETILKYEGSFIKQTSGLICAVPNELERLKHFNKNYLLLNNYPIIIETELSKDEFLSRPKCACYTGIISQERGIDCVVEGLGDIKGQLLIAGSVSNEYLTKLMEKNNWSNINFFGSVDRKTMIDQIWSKSIAGVVLFQPIDTYIESVPNKLFEYMSAGIPVIASNFPTWETFIEKHKCGIVIDPSEPNALKDAFQKLSYKPEFAYELGQNGLRAVKAEVNWNAEAQKLLNFYQSILFELK